MRNVQHYVKSVLFLESLSGLRRATAYGALRCPKSAMERMRILMKRLGNPERSYRIIHVTGTSGKGSTVMMIGNILRAWGKRTGVYLSPHTTTAIERFQGPDGALMSPATFARIARSLRHHIEALDQTPYGAPSYLEAMVAMALLSFRQQRCEWVVLEVGMGGRWDATSIIPAPAVAVITPIDNDHLHLIGPTLRDVVKNKSFIIKRGSRVFTSEQRPKLRDVLRKRCQSVGASWHAELLPLPQGTSLAIPGAHQRKNAQLAFSIGKHLHIPEDVCLQGIAETRLPCRFETVQSHPTVILDGAHNALAIRSLAQSMTDLHPRRLHILLALAENKPAQKILQHLPPAHTLLLTRFVSTSRASMSPGALKLTLQRLGLSRRYQRIITCLDPQDALVLLLQEASRSDTILVTGSLYLAGSLRKRWISEEIILQTRSSFQD